MRLLDEKFLFGSIVFLGLLLGIAFFIESQYSTKNEVLNQVQETLFHISVAAEDNLKGQSFDELLTTESPSLSSHESQVLLLNKILQPQTESLSVNGVGIMYYDAIRDSVIAYAPENSVTGEFLKPLPKGDPSLEVLTTKKSFFHESISSWLGQVYILSVPLSKNGQTFGLLNICLPKEIVNEKLKSYTIQHMSISMLIFGVWILGLSIFYYFRKLKFQEYYAKPWSDLLNYSDQKVDQILKETIKTPPIFRSFLESTYVHQQILKRILDQSSVGFAILNSKSKIIYMNQKLAEMTGYTIADFNELTDLQKKSLLRPVNSQERLNFLLHEETEKELHADYLLYSKNQETIPVEVRGFNIINKDKIEGMVISIYDLREYHQFRSLQTQTTLLLEALNEGVLILHKDGTIAYMNRAFEEIFSTAREEWVGKSIFSSTMEESVHEKLRLVLDGSYSRVHLMPKEFLSRQNPHLSLDILQIQAPNQSISGALLIGRDLTTEWQWSELSKRTDLEDSLSQIAASMVHEVRNPLTSVKGFLQLLSKETPNPEKLQLYVNVMMNELERANSIISEYLNLARKNLAKKESVSLLKLLDDIRILMESEAVIRGINLYFYLIDVTILCDPTKIKQVIINLIRNALEATSRGKSVTVSSRVLEGSDMIQLQVVDTGTGIPPEVLSQIFTPFYTTKIGGTGLGLPVCKQIVEEHEGTIQVTSKEEKGSCFTICLPLHTMDSDEQAPLSPQDVLA